MCGRLNIIQDPVNRFLSDLLGVTLPVAKRGEVFPCEPVSSLTYRFKQPGWVNLLWGIHPPWAKKLIINARAETVSSKATFRQAFSSHRILVPCSGWYEWAVDDNGLKTKYLITSETPLLMAGIQIDQNLVTLTVESDPGYAPYHSRKPLLISPDDLEVWYTTPATALLESPWQPELIFTPESHKPLTGLF